MAASRSLANPPWKRQVKEILQKNLNDGHTSSGAFSLATIKAGSPPRPAVRTVGFRGFVGELDGGPPGNNPPAESSLILVSTDSFMPKVDQLEQSDGAYEVCWRHEGTNQQIRFNGTAHVHRRNERVEFPASRLKQYISVNGNNEKEWTWESERERVWKSHRPDLRGALRNPRPGSPLDSEEKRKKLGPVELSGDDDGPVAAEAKDRFAMLVLEVTELEILHLDSLPVSTCLEKFTLRRVNAGKAVPMDFIARLNQGRRIIMACDGIVSVKIESRKSREARTHYVLRQYASYHYSLS